MSNIYSSELLFYGGICVMVSAVVAAIVAIILFRIYKEKIRHKLEEEYGKPHI